VQAHAANRRAKRRTPGARQPTASAATHITVSAAEGSPTRYAPTTHPCIAEHGSKEGLDSARRGLQCNTLGMQRGPFTRERARAEVAEGLGGGGNSIRGDGNIVIYGDEGRDGGVHGG
jgi:hypothetical protein